MIKLFVPEILDEKIRENFRRLLDYFRQDSWRKGNFKFFSIDLDADVTSGYPGTLDILHTLGFVPKDVITLSISPSTNAATGYATEVLWNYDSFTRTTVSVTFSAACTVRAFIGRYGES